MCFVPYLKKIYVYFKGTNFSATEDAMSAADDWFAIQRPEFYMPGVKKLEQPSRKCDELRGRMSNKLCVKPVSPCLFYKTKDLATSS
jgi:hypothetical protein